MSIKLFNGLLDIGGILTETYYRKSRASSEAKQELGLDPNKEYDANIGIASIDEYVVLSASGIGKNVEMCFYLSEFEQDLKLCSMYIDNANQDSAIIEVQIPSEAEDAENGYSTLLVQTFNRNKTPVAFPDAPLPPNVRLKVTAKSSIDYLQLALKPCSIIARGYGVPARVTLQQGPG